MSFGEVFKANRKRIGFTQEEIANRLMVTPQAVSKWENTSAMPDITLIVPISRLFGITTDELLENCAKSNEDILVELDETRNTVDDIRERYRLYLEMIKQYPYSRDTLSRTIGCIAQLLSVHAKNITEEEKEELVSKAESFSEELRKLGEKDGTNDYTYSHAFLADVYMSAEEFEKALKEIEHLPYSRYNKARMNGNLLHRQKKYEDAIDHYRESISDSIYWLFWDIERLAHCLWRASGDNTSSLRIFQLIYDLIHRLYEDNLYPIPVTQYLLQANIQLAAQNARNSNKEDAYQHLDEIVGILETFEKLYGNTLETGCILYPIAIQPFNKFGRKISYKNWFLRSLEWNSFETLKEEGRFKKYYNLAESMK